MRLIFAAVAALAVALVVEATVSSAAGGIAALVLVVAFGIAYYRYCS